MKKRKKVFVPSWLGWFLIPMYFLIWGFIGYLEYFGPKSSEHELGTIGFIFVSLIFGGMIVLFLLLSSGRLPAYLIEEDDEK